MKKSINPNNGESWKWKLRKNSIRLDEGFLLEFHWSIILTNENEKWNGSAMRYKLAKDLYFVEHWTEINDRIDDGNFYGANHFRIGPRRYVEEKRWREKKVDFPIWYEKKEWSYAHLKKL